ncbi:hypothetical protein OUZ56_025368 [Daphnia magna]|uniref:Uncharacterized protein n=1 Tax=Daphnia magna TaxID=35525 RepID=A0ABQ9ZJN1_9CRUS|nr:hypothetical protein OUZ56_025368 [Daphnia magna]
MNARFCKEGITVLNWLPKKKKLEEMLVVLKRTEMIYLQSDNREKMFASTTTIRGWRTSIQSTIAITEELFSENYGKLNQDALEVTIIKYHIVDTINEG